MLLICCIPAEIFLDIRHLVRQACDNSREKEDTSSSSFFDLLKVEKCLSEDIRTLSKAILIAYIFPVSNYISLTMAKHMSHQKREVLKKLQVFFRIFQWCDVEHFSRPPKPIVPCTVPRQTGPVIRATFCFRLFSLLT